MTRPDLVLEVIVCAVDPSSRAIRCDEARVKVCEVVASVIECRPDPSAVTRSDIMK